MTKRVERALEGCACATCELAKKPSPKKDKFLLEVERRAGASRKRMLDWIQNADSTNAYDTERPMYWLRRILGETMMMLAVLLLTACAPNSPAPQARSARADPPAVVTPCVDVPYGRVWGRGWCQDCRGAIVPGDGGGHRPGTPCSAPKRKQ